MKYPLEFDSKTKLSEHIQQLVHDKYLEEHIEIEQIKGGTRGRKYYTINYNSFDLINKIPKAK